MREEKSGTGCDCDCECCKQGKCRQKPAKGGDEAISTIRVTDTVGASFLGILAILLLIFLVRSNKRNRELLLEFIELRRQT